MQMIVDYISSIRYEDEDQHYTFFGDGEGDFEERSELTTKECIKEYIVFCEQQKQLAINWLNSNKI